jgi:hypothetical protein
MDRHFGEGVMTLQVHRLFHVARAIRGHGPLWQSWLFAFERMIKEYKGYITGTRFVGTTLSEAIVAKFSLFALAQLDRRVLHPTMSVPNYKDDLRFLHPIIEAVDGERKMLELTPEVKLLMENYLKTFGDLELRGDFIKTYPRMTHGTVIYKSSLNRQRPSDIYSVFKSGNRSEFRVGIVEYFFKVSTSGGMLSLAMCRFRPHSRTSIKVFPGDMNSENSLPLVGNRFDPDDGPLRIIPFSQIAGRCILIPFEALIREPSDPPIDPANPKLVVLRLDIVDLLDPE